MELIKLTCTVLLFTACLNMSARNKKAEFGKIDIAELEAGVCPVDSSAKAYYIFDQGETEFVYNHGYQLDFRRHLRIKILDESAIDRASFKFAFYINRIGPEETIGAIKAQTYNLLNGEVNVTKMDRKNVIRKNKDKYWNTVEFALPDVKAGSVIDVVYTINSKYMYKLKGWNFQYDIPVLKSDYSVEIPIYFSYKQYPYGDVGVDFNQSTSHGSIDYSLDTDFYFTNEVLNYSASDVPAVECNDSISVLGDIVSRIEYSLSATNFPKTWKNFILETSGDPLQTLKVPDWIDINNDYCLSYNYLDRNTDRSSLKDEAKQLKTSSQDSMSLMQSVYSYVKEAVKWDETYYSYSLNSIAETMENGAGNSADINLALVALLREVGLDAYPVVLKTMDKGFVRVYNPSMTQFNHVIAACVVKGKMYLMDACENDSDINRLPLNCINGQGLLIDSKAPRWVDIINKEQ